MFILLLFLFDTVADKQAEWFGKAGNSVCWIHWSFDILSGELVTWFRNKTEVNLDSAQFEN